MKKEKELNNIKSNDKVLIIIPAYNEEESIFNTYRSVINYNKKHKSNSLDVIVINDGSRDFTKQILEENRIPHINLVHNLGIGGAVQTGYKYALENGYDYAIQFDGDGQHDIHYVETILELLRNGKADLCIGSRFLDNTSDFKSTGVRRAGIKIISFLISLFSHIKITDPTSGFRAANRNVIQHFADRYPREYPEPESIVNLTRLKYRVVERPVKMNERTGGVSSIRAWKTVYYMINVGLSIIVTSLKRKGDC